jgi:O-antigen/teichoic acid export membrane protein
MTNVRASFKANGAAERGPKTSVPGRSLLVGVMTVFRRHRDLLSNAGSLVATTGVASALGFLYWALAARLFTQEAVGYGAAAVSAMTLLGTVGMFGLGTVLIGELPRRRPRAGLVSAALLASGLGSMVLGLGFAVVAPSVSGRFGHITGTPGQATLFAAGVMVTGASLVFDQATIGLMRGGLQLSRNVAFAVAKLLALPAAAIILHYQFGVGITVSWVVGTAVSLVPVAIWLRLTGTPVLPRPDWGVLRGLGRTAIAHSCLNIAITVPWSLIPVLVTVVISPSANAAFYVAWMLVNFLYIVPGALSTVLFAVAAADPQMIAPKLRFTLRLSLLIGLPGMAALILGGHLALTMFGAGYERAAMLPLSLLTIGYLPAIPKIHYIAVCRAAGKIPRAAAVLSAAATSEVTAAALGGALGGLKGLSFALLGVYLVEGLVTAPPVFSAAKGHGRHRRATSLTAATHPDTSPIPTDALLRHRQEAGITALLSLATPAVSTIMPSVHPPGYSGKRGDSVRETHTAAPGRPVPPNR